MISGISGNSGIYGSQALINQYRLEQAMQKRFADTSSISPVNRIPSVQTQGTSLADSMTYLKSYSSTMADVMSSANALRSGNAASVTSKLDAVSSDSQVLEASGRYRLTSEESYSVDVSQLAASQVNVSEAAATGAKAAGDINMQISINGKTLDITALAEDGGNTKTNGQIMAEAARKINEADAGLKATVLTKDGKSSLQIASTDTGNSHSFSVSGDFAADGKGGMSNVTQAAQNAAYTVTQNGISRSAESESNKISLDYGKIDVTLKKEGTADINVGIDPQKVVSAMDKFVTSYNNAVTFLSKNADRGVGTTRELSKLQSSVPGSTESMEQLGLSFNKDGTLSLDMGKLSDSLKKDPALTQDLISGNYGIAQRSFNAAKSGMSTSVSSLISNDLAETEYQQMNDSINFMNAYSRRGSYNMMNYYASGMMLNTFA